MRSPRFPNGACFVSKDHKMLLCGETHLSGPDICGIMWWLNSLKLKCFRTNSTILSSEMQSYDSIITTVITAACDTSLREHAEQSVCLGSPHSQVYIIDGANKLQRNLLTNKG